MKKILCLCVVMFSLMHVVGQTTVADVFKSAPKSVLPLLDANTRLDMIDYFNSGMSSRTSNMLQGKSDITSMSSESMTIKMTAASSCQMALLTMDGEKVIMVINTVATPALDSKMTMYTSDWTKDITSKVFAAPSMTEWLTSAGRKNKSEVESLVPFMIVGYEFDSGTGVLTLTNNASNFLAEDIYNKVKPYLLSQKQYKWSGKKFEPVK